MRAEPSPWRGGAGATASATAGVAADDARRHKCIPAQLSNQFVGEMPGMSFRGYRSVAINRSPQTAPDLFDA